MTAQGELFEKENNLKVSVPTDFMNMFLNSIPAKGFPVVAIEFKNDIRVRSYSVQRSEYMMYNAKHDEMKIDQPGYLVVDVNTFKSHMVKFSGLITIEWQANQKIKIYDASGNEVEIVPRNISEIENLIPAENRLYPTDPSGVVYFPRRDASGKLVKKGDGFELDKMATHVILTSSEINKGMLDMDIAKADYAVYNFSSGGSFASSGRYNAKGNMSKSSLSANVSGENAEVVVPSILKDVMKVMEGNVTVQADARFKMVFFSSVSSDEHFSIRKQIGIVQWEPKARKDEKKPETKKEE